MLFLFLFTFITNMVTSLPIGLLEPPPNKENNNWLAFPNFPKISFDTTSNEMIQHSITPQIENVLQEFSNPVYTFENTSHQPIEHSTVPLTEIIVESQPLEPLDYLVRNTSEVNNSFSSFIAPTQTEEYRYTEFMDDFAESTTPATIPYATGVLFETAEVTHELIQTFKLPPPLPPNTTPTSPHIPLQSVSWMKVIQVPIPPKMVGLDPFIEHAPGNIEMVDAITTIPSGLRIVLANKNITDFNSTVTSKSSVTSLKPLRGDTTKTSKLIVGLPSLVGKTLSEVTGAQGLLTTNFTAVGFKSNGISGSNTSKLYENISSSGKSTKSSDGAMLKPSLDITLSSSATANPTSKISKTSLLISGTSNQTNTAETTASNKSYSTSTLSSSAPTKPAKLNANISSSGESNKSTYAVSRKPSFDATFSSLASTNPTSKISKTSLLISGTSNQAKTTVSNKSYSVLTTTNPLIKGGETSNSGTVKDPSLTPVTLKPATVTKSSNGTNQGEVTLEPVQFEKLQQSTTEETSTPQRPKEAEDLEEESHADQQFTMANMKKVPAMNELQNKTENETPLSDDDSFVMRLGSLIQYSTTGGSIITLISSALMYTLFKLFDIENKFLE